MTKHGYTCENEESRNKMIKKPDLISQLCDAVIYHILSFLPVNDAAKTSVLSKRWRNIWASTPVLDFDQKFFCKKIGDLRSHPDCALVEFMSGAALRREQAPINTLRMSLEYNPIYYFAIRQWIQVSLMSNVQEIYLDLFERNSTLQHHSLGSSDPLQAYYCDGEELFHCNYTSSSESSTDESSSDEEYSSSGESYSRGNESDRANLVADSQSSHFKLFPSLFTYGSLRVLQLKGCNITDEGPMEFRTLTSLVLSNVNISEKVLHKMLSTCSLLEKLEIQKIVGLENLKISSLTLHSMKLGCCHSLKEVFISAKELRCFKFCGFSTKIKLLSFDFPAIVKAEIGFCRDENFIFSMRKRPEHLVEAFNCFVSHVKDLTLYSRRFKDMLISKDQMKGFTLSEVRRFEIIGSIGYKGIMGYYAIPAIFGLLEALVNLESFCLTFVHQKKSQTKAVDHHVEGQLRKLDTASINCFHHSLKELKVFGLEGNVSEIRIVKFILENAKVLENVDIKTYTPSFLSHQEIKTRLLNCRSSEDVKLHYG